MATEATTQATEEKVVEKVTFTPEQQARVDEIIRERMGHAGREAKQEAATLATEVTALKADLESTRAELGKAKTPAEKKEIKEQVAALEATMAEMKAVSANKDAEVDRLKQLSAAKDKEITVAKAEAVTIRKRNAIQNVATQLGFLDPDMITKLTEDDIIYNSEKNKWDVIGDNGQPRLNSAYEPMGLEEYFSEYATKKPFLVRGDVKSGAGSSQAKQSGLSAAKYTAEQIFGPKSNGALANNLAKTDIKEYHRLKAIAKETGLIA